MGYHIVSSIYILLPNYTLTYRYAYFVDWNNAAAHPYKTHADKTTNHKHNDAH